MDEVLLFGVVCLSEYLLDRRESRHLWFLHCIMTLTALQLVERFPPPPAASGLSDITNIAIGQNKVTIILTFSLGEAVRQSQYVHRTESDRCHWLYCAAPAGCRFATCLQAQPDDASAAGRALQPCADYSQTEWSDNSVGSYCIISPARRYAGSGVSDSG